MICKSCHITILSDVPHCPLCNIPIPHETEKNPIQKVAYPNYATIKKKDVSNIVAFFAITMGILCVFINIFTFDTYPSIWSLTVVSSLLCFHRSVFDWVSSVRNSGAKIVAQFFLLSQLMVAIDITLGYTGWSFSYVIPWFSIAATLTITIIAFANKKNYIEYIGYLMASVSLSICLAFIAILPVATIKWALLAALLYSVFTILGLYMFSKTRFKNEMKRRFKY